MRSVIGRCGGSGAAAAGFSSRAEITGPVSGGKSMAAGTRPAAGRGGMRPALSSVGRANRRSFIWASSRCAISLRGSISRMTFTAPIALSSWSWSDKIFAAVWYQEIAFAESPIRRYASPRRSRCVVSLGSCLASCSRTSTAFSSFPFLRSSAAESLSLRVSTKSLGMRGRGYRANRGVRKKPPYATAFGLRARAKPASALCPVSERAGRARGGARGARPGARAQVAPSCPPGCGATRPPRG